MTTIDAPQAHAGKFDPKGWTTTRHYEGWDTDRYAEGPFTVEVEDSYGTSFSVDGIEEMMPWIGDNADIGYVHGTRGFISLGRILAWKRASVRDPKTGDAHDGIVIRAGIKKGDPDTGAGGLIDDIWTREIQPHGTMAGWSLGGRAIEKTCDAKGHHCYFLRTDIVEISWTPSPSNPLAHLTAVSVSRGAAGELATVLTAHMHRAYNDFADGLATAGRLSTEQRVKIGNAVGAGLAAVEAGLPRDVATMIVVDPDVPAVPVGREGGVVDPATLPRMTVDDAHVLRDRALQDAGALVSTPEPATLLEQAAAVETSIEEAVASYFQRNPDGVDHDATWFRTRCHRCAGFIALLGRAGLSEADAASRLEAALERARIRAGMTRTKEDKNVPGEQGAASTAGATGGQPAGDAQRTAAGPATPPNGAAPTGTNDIANEIRSGFARIDERMSKEMQAVQDKIAQLDGRVAAVEGKDANAQRQSDEDEKKKKDEEKEKMRSAASGSAPLTFASKDEILAYVKRENLLGNTARTPAPAPSPANGRAAGGLAAQRTGGARYGTTVRREVEHGEKISALAHAGVASLRRKPAATNGGGN